MVSVHQVGNLQNGEEEGQTFTNNYLDVPCVEQTFLTLSLVELDVLIEGPFKDEANNIHYCFLVQQSEKQNTVNLVFVLVPDLSRELR